MKNTERYDFSHTRRLLEHYVQAGELAGASLQVTQHGQTVLATQTGYADRERKRPISTDTIFRIYSMSKPVTAVLFMILYERGLVGLNDPVSEYLPGFAQPRVLVRRPDGSLDTEPARSAPTLRHLLTMTSGIPDTSDGSPASQAVSRAMGVLDEEAAAGKTLDLPAMANRIGGLPLSCHPGEHWQYALSLDIIGAVLEVAAGKKLGQLMQEEIFEPLGMTGTGFYVPAEQAHRLAVLYGDTGGRLVPDVPGLIPGDPFSPPVLESGGGGLYSTRSDYTRFARMLLGGGELEGCRIISGKSVRLMCQNHLNAAQLEDYSLDLKRGYGYGLAVRTLIDPVRAGTLASPGEFGWSGAAGTWFGVDPAADMTLVFMTQRLPAEHARFVPRLATTVYAALCDH